MQTDSEQESSNQITINTPERDHGIIFIGKAVPKLAEALFNHQISNNCSNNDDRETAKAKEDEDEHDQQTSPPNPEFSIIALRDSIHFLTGNSKEEADKGNESDKKEMLDAKGSIECSSTPITKREDESD